MKGQIFRIAHLGYFDFADLFAVIAELEIILEANGYPVRFGSGVAAVQRVLYGCRRGEDGGSGLRRFVWRVRRGRNS